MGSRADYVVVEHGSWRLYSSHLAATTIDVDLMAGPVSALRFIRAQHGREPHDWLDDIWCEGAALVDLDRRELLFFASDLDGYAHRAAVLEVLCETWAGWCVHWAYDGLGDLVARVGLDRSTVRRGTSPDEPEAADSWVECLVTVDDGERVRAYPLQSCSAGEVVGHGDGFAARIPAAAERTSCPEFPDSGVHLDLPGRSAGLWTTDTLGGALERTAELWPGWRWEFWADDHERQRALAGGAVRLPTPSPDSGFGSIGTRLDRHRNYDPIGSAHRFIDRMAAHDTGVRPSPELFDHVEARPTAAEWAALEAAVRRCAAGRHRCSRPPSWCSASASSSSNHLPFSPR
ncbi:hypothetical protein CLV63_119111 [Murinocardiopsis flavida]|uniref:Uncharacterized protein n=1 Tax=Murinocardiopsis flavida TaxID=645275 RepID=A0A2P8D3N2_9ACTN|nr:hypothetical protein [Murinocardiopsis flavida]PSK91830.1 hypothetical protein CLV63_119111 [Murinocardiopsis flavida]